MTRQWSNLRCRESLRGLIERERGLHGLLAKAAGVVLREMLRKAAVEPDGVPGVVVSLQTFGSFANFHPHVHVISTEGVLTPDGRFHPVIWPRKRDLEERFCRCFLDLLLRAKRLSASFHETLLNWRRSGFWVDASQRVGAGEEARLERQARSAHGHAGQGPGPPRLRARGLPADPRREAPPDAQLRRLREPEAPGTSRRVRGGEDGREASPEGEAAPVSPSSSVLPASADAARRSSWARMLRKVFGAEPLTCPRCDVEMEIVAWITQVEVIDRILKHRRERGLASPFEPRAPPAA